MSAPSINNVSAQSSTIQRATIKDCQRWVVKVGSSLLTDDGRGLDNAFISNLAAQIAWLKAQQIELVLVSSGAVAAGVAELSMKKRPTQVKELQAVAAVGQALLVRSYKEVFKPLGITIAQVLLTHADIANRERYLNAKGTLSQLLNYDVLTIVNENDTVATEEIRFGDNDNLGALVANIVDADLLVILTDQQGLYTADPRQDSNAELLSLVKAGDENLSAMASEGGELGQGGMVTKLTAARNASNSGASTIIASGLENDILKRLYAGEELGTLLVASDRLASKKQWMAGQMRIAGTLVVDDGAVDVLQGSGSSLLAVGVVDVSGEFKRGELLSCVNLAGVEVARGLSNYHSAEAKKIKGRTSQQIPELLGYGGAEELIHRDNLVLL